ncbi:hypothetical protein Dimus_039516 [Dionaea muscipula]
MQSMGKLVQTNVNLSKLNDSLLTKMHSKPNQQHELRTHMRIMGNCTKTEQKFGQKFCKNMLAPTIKQTNHKSGDDKREIKKLPSSHSARCGSLFNSNSIKSSKQQISHLISKTYTKKHENQSREQTRDKTKAKQKQK